MRFRIAVFLLAAITALFGQGERGNFNGTVSDPSGAVIGNAAVRAIHVGTNVETLVHTTEAGVYRMPYLPPGTYRLTASASGFRTVVRENVGLSVAQTLTVDFSLEVGAVTDQVTVSTEAPLLETGTAEIGSYVSKKEFDTWPITVGDGRRQIQQFIFTSLPGTVGGTFQGSINGGQFYTHEILIDGISLGRFDLNGGSNNEFSPSAETVSEFKLQTGTVSAQYTGGATAVANFATKSGTNQLHGTAYYYVQNDAFRANGWNNNAAAIKRQPFKQHNYGFSVGGPVLLPKIYNGKNKSFFFMDWERTKVRDYTSTSFTQLPVVDFKRGDFSRLLSNAFTGNAGSGTNAGMDAMGRPVVFGAIFDPNTARQVGTTWVRDPFPGNAVPQNRWSPISRNILTQTPIDDPLFDTMLNNMPALGTCCPHFDEKMLTIKGDHTFTSNHRVAATYNRNYRQRNNSPGGRWGIPPGSATGVYQLQNTPGWLGRLAYDWTITPTLLNHFAIGYNRFGNLNQSVYVDEGWPEKLGYQNLPGTHFPPLVFGGQPYQGGNIGGGGRLGSANAGGSFNGSTIFQDDMTFIRGKHNFKAGFEHRRYYFNEQGRGNESATFNFSPNQTAQPGFLNQTGHSFASFLLGAVSTTNRNVVASYFGRRWRDVGFYFMDDWKVNRKLTLNLGVRWTVIGGLMEVAGRMAQLDFTKPNPGAGNRPGAVIFADELGVNGFMDTYWQMWAPKLGFAYQITSKLVMRGGYGINNMPPINNGFGGPSTIGYNGSIARSSANTALRFAEEPVMYLQDRYPDFGSALPNRDPSIANGQGITYVGPDHNRVPYVQNWNFGFQYELPASTVLELNYVANQGTRLRAGGFDNLNALPFDVISRYGNALNTPWTAASGVPQPYPGFVGTVAQALRPFPQYTGISQPYPYFGTSNYQSLQIQATRHFKNGIAILGAYTWSKALSIVDSSIDGDFQGVSDVFNRGLERGVTQFHYPHFAKVTWIYDLPFGKGKRFGMSGVADAVLGGWQLTGNHQFRSGASLAITTGGVNNPVGTGAVRPDLIAGQNIIANSDAPINFRGIAGGTAYLNRAAFANPPVQPGGQNIIARFGTAPPILPNIRGPHFTYEDLGIQKTFRFTEFHTFELRGTFLNPFNRHGRGNPVTDIQSPFFGQITGQQIGGRNIELAGRFTF